ncbi:hypothetical protein [Streptomyces vinaceus]|uniref:hypothetical protein n=1 Tax=Streptomyces vinaceus TaxID=1960 RepID=UPI0036A204B4
MSLQSLMDSYGPHVRDFFVGVDDPDTADMVERAGAVCRAIAEGGFHLTDVHGIGASGSAEDYLRAGPVVPFGGGPHTVSQAYFLLMHAFDVDVVVRHGSRCVDPAGVDALRGVTPNVDNGWIIYTDYQWVRCPALGELHLPFFGGPLPRLGELDEAEDAQGHRCVWTDAPAGPFHLAPPGSEYEWAVHKERGCLLQ